MSSELKAEMILNIVKEEKLLRRIVTEIQGSGCVPIIYYDVEETCFFIDETFLKIKELGLSELGITEHCVDGYYFGSIATTQLSVVKNAITNVGWLWVTGNNKFL